MSSTDNRRSGTDHEGSRRQNANNRRLAELVAEACLTQAQALDRFNRFLGPRPLSIETWKGYFMKPESSRYRYFRDDFLAIAEEALKVERARS